MSLPIKGDHFENSPSLGVVHFLHLYIWLWHPGNSLPALHCSTAPGKCHHLKPLQLAMHKILQHCINPSTSSTVLKWYSHSTSWMPHVCCLCLWYRCAPYVQYIVSLQLLWRICWFGAWSPKIFCHIFWKPQLHHLFDCCICCVSYVHFVNCPELQWS